MPTNHYAVAAVPATGATALLRAGLVGRYAYCLAVGESAGDFVAIDPNNGSVCPALIQNGVLYGLDNADTTTAAGPTCLVSYDGKRYKLNSLTTPFSVLSKGLTSPPGSPAIGNVYLLYSTPTGAWAGKIGNIAIYTSRGWEFMLPPVGFRVLVEDEGSFYFRDPSGNWLAGLGSVLVPDSSIALSKLIWDGRVQNQTTNAPPSAAQGVAYIIGSSATGAWLGNAGKIAIRESAGTNSTYAVYTPKVGQVVYDIAQATFYVWDGSVWKPQFSGYSQVLSAQTKTTATIAGSGSAFNGVPYSATVAPTTVSAGVTVITDTLTLDVQADFAGQTIEVEYVANLYDVITTTGTGSVSSKSLIAAAYVDTETTARDWSLCTRTVSPGDGNFGINQAFGKFELTLADTSLHTIKIKLHAYAAYGSTQMNAFSVPFANRRITARKRR